MSDPDRYQSWVNLLSDYDCSQLFAGLTQSSGIGHQHEPLATLNGYSVGNTYVEVITALVDMGLKGAEWEQINRTVDTVFNSADLEVDQKEREILAYLLSSGQL